MPADSTGSPDLARPGLRASLVALARNASGLLLCRLELLGLELAGFTHQLLQLLLLGALAVLCVACSLGLLLTLLIYLAWPSLGWLILPLLALLFLVLAAGLLFWVQRLLRSEPLSLPLTLAELRQDRAQLG